MNNQGNKTSPSSVRRRLFLLVILAAFGSVSLVRAQTSSFTYQGRLTDGATAANATYDMQFKLFDTASAGNQIGSTIMNGAVLVSNGVFTVQLDYGAAAFSGADRYLEIGVRLAGDANPYTILTPRQQLTSAVYAIRAGSATNADTATNASTATNATQLGGVAAGQYVQTNDARLSDARVPTAGSNNYIQNTENSLQVANFNITGNGLVGGTLSATVVNANAAYYFDGRPVLRTGNAADNNTFTGFGAGKAYNSSANGPGINGKDNSFYGFNSGVGNTTGEVNSFFGSSAGSSNTTGSANSFFGGSAGAANTTGHDNSFFGVSAGGATTTGSNNSFFGRFAGQHNTSGNGNSFFGREAGNTNTSGFDNSFFGRSAGASNTTGPNNSFFGIEAGNANTTGGANAFFGSRAGTANTTGFQNSFFGNSAGSKTNSGTLNSFFGSAVGYQNTTGLSNSFFGGFAGSNNITGTYNSFFGVDSGIANVSGDYNTAIGSLANVASGDLNHATVIGAEAVVSTSNTIMLGRISGVDKVRVPGLGIEGATAICRNANHELSTCSSSLRYKKDLQPFTRGLALLNQLKPITFKWKADSSADLGFGAEDIAAVEPLLVTHNDKGQVEGVKYDRITAVLVNAVKEQQAQIKQQQNQIESLKKLVCQRNRRAAVCK